MPLNSWLLPLFITLVCPFNLHAQQHSAIQTVVIDAGHGGHDPGAIGQHAKEKNINLAIALKLGGMIQRSFKDVRVIYTRDKDNFVELYRRAEIANKNKADLFICIHCNANNNHALKGAETYVMGLHKSRANLDIAKLENASILLESDYQSTYNGFDPNADESYIIFSLYQNSNLDQSTGLAAAIQSRLVENDGKEIRGVRQAGFMVLYKTTMPSVLVETGYLSNPEEEQYLTSDKGQDHIASAIFKAFKTFRESVANRTGVQAKSDQKDSVTAETPSSRGLTFKVQIAASKDEIETGNPRFARFGKVNMYRHGGMYKYTTGDETSLPAAEKLLDEVKGKGAADAFIVIFRDGKRIPEAEAKRLLKK